MHHLLGGCALRSEVHQPCQQHAGVEEVARRYGHRFRSSSTSAATSTAGRSSGAHGRPCHQPLAHAHQLRTGGHAFEPDAELVDRHLQDGAGLQTGALANRRGDDDPARLVDGRSHAISLPS